VLVMVPIAVKLGVMVMVGVNLGVKVFVAVKTGLRAGVAEGGMLVAVFVKVATTPEDVVAEAVVVAVKEEPGVAEGVGLYPGAIGETKECLLQAEPRNRTAPAQPTRNKTRK
jgi:hypothetical protein